MRLVSCDKVRSDIRIVRAVGCCDVISLYPHMHADNVVGCGVVRVNIFGPSTDAPSACLRNTMRPPFNWAPSVDTKFQPPATSFLASPVTTFLAASQG